MTTNVLTASATAEWLQDFGVWAVFISLLLNVAISILGVVPSVFLSGANAVVFGLPMGFAVSLLGEMLGAFVSYWLYRKGILSVRKKGKPPGKWSRSFHNASLSKQFTLLLVARIAPFLPSGVITFAAAWTKMNVIPFMVATALGKAPSVAAEVWLGHDLFYLLWNLF